MDAMAKGFIVFSMILWCLSSLAAYGDDLSRYEISGAYSLMRAAKPCGTIVLNPYSTFNISISGNNPTTLSGYKFGVGFNLNRRFGIIGEVGYHHRETAPLQISHYIIEGLSYCSPASRCINNALWSIKNYGRREIFSMLAGPRLSVNLSKSIRPFAQVLMGLSKNHIAVGRNYGVVELHGLWTASTLIGVEQESVNSFALAGGGGFDIILHKRFSIRLFEIEAVTVQEPNLSYRVDTEITQNNNGSNSVTFKSDTVYGSPNRKWKNSMRLSFGAAFHFGKKL
jgi:hypothetical protein